MISYALLHVPAVQTWIVQKVASVFSKKLNTKVTVQHVDFAFFNKLEIKGVVVQDRQKDTLPKFSSPFVQGPYLNNFIYLDIGTLAGQIGSWQRRLKIPLTGITWEIVDQLKTESNLILETKVPGTAKDGTPNCATVKPFDGWQIISTSPTN